MNVETGSAFHFNDRSSDDHLYVVISDTRESEVVIVNMTTVRPLADLSCVFEPDDHEFFAHKTRIAYEFSQTVPTDILEQKNEQGRIRIRYKFDAKLMERIWDGAVVSPNMPLNCLAILRRQQLI